MHEHHRQRMKARVIADGAESLALHELLEMLLYYGKPQGDTNPTAHELVERFGGMKGILEASIDDLVNVKGIGEHTAILFRLLNEALRRYARETITPAPCYHEISKIACYIHNYFVGLKKERLYMMLFNNRMNMIDCVMVSEGSVNRADVSLRFISEKIIQKNAANVVLAHNHPDGLPIPSREDIELTDVIRNHLQSLGVNLIEHLIVSGYTFDYIMRQHCGMYRVSPISGLIECSYYEAFYDVDPKTFHFDPYFDEKVDALDCQ